MGKYDIFVRDMVTGTTELVSKSTAGVLSNFDSGPAEISNDGRYVAFTSGASNLVAGDTNNQYDVIPARPHLGHDDPCERGYGGQSVERPQWDPEALPADFGQRTVRLVRVGRDEPGASRHERVTTDIYIRDLQLGTTSSRV
jgi:hypothetical protein